MKKQRVTLFLDPDLVKKAKGQAVEEGTSLSELVAKYLEQRLPQIVKVTTKKKK